MVVVGVKIGDSKEILFFNAGKLRLKKNLTVIVDGERGLEFGTVIDEPFVTDDKKYKGISNVIRIASRDDFYRNKKNLKDAKDALHKCKELVLDYGLHMVIVDCKYTFDRNQLVFRFLSDSRIDFRDLARELASIYKTRIELRQIGARDKAREIGGCGMCGRPLCCSGFLKDLDTVSINMAKNQGIALNPSKINGVCGRLMCCLKYEDDDYSKCRKNLPSVGSMTHTPFGEGKVVSIDCLNSKFKVEVPDIGIVEVESGSN